MKKIIFAIVLTLNIFNVQAKNIQNEGMLKQFYTDYFSYSKSCDNRAELLVESNCTAAFYQAWREDVTEIGLYDPLTNGHCGDYDMYKRTLSVTKGKSYYIVSFNYITWPGNKTVTETVYVYVNENGYISHTKRPSDGYMTPSK